MKLNIICSALIFATLLSVFGLWHYFLCPVLYTLPQPTGPHHVGTTSYEIKNNTYDFMVRFWYPTDQISQVKDTYGNAVQNNYIIEEFFKKTLPISQCFFKKTFNLKNISQQNLPISQAESMYPVLIYTPGSSMSYDYYDALLSNLASHGYIVVAFNSTPMQPVAYPDGRFVPDTRVPMPRVHNLVSEDTLIGKSYFEDVIANFSKLLSWLKQTNNDKTSLWYNRLNLQKTFMMGHSFGGVTTTHIAQQDFNLAGCINLDGIMTTTHTAPLKIPLLVLLTDTPSPNFDSTVGYQQVEQFCKPLELCNIKTIPGSGHMSFSDLGFIKWQKLIGDTNYLPGVPALYGPKDPYLVLQNISDEILMFLKQK